MEGAGQGAVSEGGDSILEFERWRRTGDPAILQAIIEYNKEDCDSTLRLRDWLIERKAEAEQRSGVAIPWKTTKLARNPEKRTEEDALTRGSPRQAACARAPRLRCSRISSTITVARQSPSGGRTSIAGRSRWTICSTTPRPSPS